MIKADFEGGKNSEKILVLLLGFLVGALLSYGLVKTLIKQSPQILGIIGFKKRFFLLLMGIVLSIPILFIKRDVFFLENHDIVSTLKLLAWAQIPIFLMTGPLFLLLAEKLFDRQINLKINVKDLYRKVEDKEFLKLENLLNDKRYIPLGISKVVKQPVKISSKYRTHHMMVTGSSGYGKTALAFTVMRHDLRWNRPVIFIDPKAKRDDIELARSYAKLYEREKDFHLFSDNLRKESVVYNPLRLGDAAAKADKICSAFELNHEHWGKVAQSFLITLFQAFEVLNIEESLQNVSKFVDSKESLQDLFERIGELPESEIVNEIRQKIPRISKMKSEELSGLQAGLTAINSSSLKHILNPSFDKKEVNLIDIVEQNQIIYFDVEPSDKGTLMSQVGRFLIKDIRFLAGRLQKDKIKLSSDFLPVFIDEVDLFIDEKFHEFSKTARSANMALMVLFQSVSSLDNIGTHLKEMIGQFDVSMHFNTVSQDDLDYTAKRPGTMSLREQSNQVDRSNLHALTGKGTEFMTDVFKLDPNLLRELDVDDFFIFDKRKPSQSKVDLVKSWSAKFHFKDAKSKLLLSDICSLSDKKKRSIPLKKITPTERVLLAEPIEIRQKCFDDELRIKFAELKEEWVEDSINNNSWYPWKFLKK